MMKKRIWFAGVLLLAAVMLLAGCRGSDKYTDVAVLSTTDMHGKCWEKNLVTDAPVKANMLRVSEAVRQVRDEYGKENVIVLDNGDAFQGTMISQLQLSGDLEWDPKMPPAMALCMKEIGYDAMTLGNHEFDFSWSLMEKTYRYLEDNGIDVLAANVVYSGDDGGHKKGDNAFTPYIIKTITVNGHEHKIGILGIENTDVDEWSPAANYPGLQFTHAGNEARDAAVEAGLYLPKMKEEGCDFIIVSYHGGAGQEGEDHVTNNQGLALLSGTEGIDLLILGHDHSSGVSNTYAADKAGRNVLIVNGGGQQLTKSVFRFTENGKGELQYEITSSENLDLSGYEPDTGLEDLIRPYAEITEEFVNRPIGTASGKWDQNTDHFCSQTDTTDLSGKALISTVSERYGSDADFALLNITAQSGYAVRPGELTIKDMYKLNAFQNSAVLLKLSGKKIRDILEETASERYTCRVIGGRPHFYTRGDYYTAVACYGLDYSLDMSRPEGERVVIEGLPDGRAFDDEAEYLVVTSDYLLSNDRCGLRDISADDAVWNQVREDPAGDVQDLYADYIRKVSADGGLTPELFNWKRGLTYSADPASADNGEGATAAVIEGTPEEGPEYIVYQEADGYTFTDEQANDGLAGVEMTASGDRLTGSIPEKALRFKVKKKEDGKLLLIDRKGRYLTCGGSGALKLAEKEADGGQSEWILKKTDGGNVLISAGSSDKGGRTIAMQYYSGRLTTYQYDDVGAFVFNFYRIKE